MCALLDELLFSTFYYATSRKITLVFVQEGSMNILSIIIPVYNEPALPELLGRLFRVEFPMETEIIIVDDGSRDGTRKWIKDNAHKLGVKVILQSRNYGKGAAIRAGVNVAKGDVIIIQDADLEYDPEDILSVVRPIFEGAIKVCYGSRRLTKAQRRKIWSGIKRSGPRYLCYYLGGLSVTILCNLLFGAKLTDELTCYKAFDARLLKSIKLISDGFELEPELTAKVLKFASIIEVPINYNPRTREEGKKINWKDGIKALTTLVKYRFID